MQKEQLKRIFDFLEDKEQQNPPLKWKLINNIPLTEEELNVKGDLDLYECKSLTSLPKGLKVGGDLDLESTNITHLPEGLKVGGDLDLSRTNITSLPKGLEVWGHLNLSKSELPYYYKNNNHLRKSIEPGFIKGDIISEYYINYDEEDDDDYYYEEGD